MKCIKCHTKNNRRSRRANQGRCKKCGHPFVFDPKTGEAMFSNLSYWTRNRFTDVFFENAINAISAEDSLYFTPKQLLYLLDKRLEPKVFKSGGKNILRFLIKCRSLLPRRERREIMEFVYLFLLPGNILSIFCAMIYNITMKIGSKDGIKKMQVGAGVIMISGIIISLVLSSSPVAGFSVYMFSIALGLRFIYLGQRRLDRIFFVPQSLSVKPRDVDIWVKRWTQVNEIPKMLPPPKEETTSVAVSPDIAAYSFDRVVVCDRAAIAQFLIANNFHFENNCAVLSISGYPQSIFSTVLKMLRRNPNLKVYVLHNASPGGVSLVHRLGSSPKWFANSDVPIYDIGLLPRHVLKSKNMFVQRSSKFAETALQLPEPVRQSLSKDELEWLELGNYVELELFTPQKLLEVVTQGIARSREIGSDDSMTYIYGDDDNTSAMIFASDSFG